MKCLVLTFPEHLDEEQADYVFNELKTAMPDVRIVLVQGASSATLIEVPDSGTVQGISETSPE